MVENTTYANENSYKKEFTVNDFDYFYPVIIKGVIVMFHNKNAPNHEVNHG